MVESGVPLKSIYGGTEFGAPTHQFPRKGDEKEWAYMEFGKQIKLRWVAQGDGTFECQMLVRSSNEYLDNHCILIFRLDE
jgi:hypothetical protein